MNKCKVYAIYPRRLRYFIMAAQAEQDEGPRFSTDRSTAIDQKSGKKMDTNPV